MGWFLLAAFSSFAAPVQWQPVAEKAGVKDVRTGWTRVNSRTLKKSVHDETEDEAECQPEHLGRTERRGIVRLSLSYTLTKSFIMCSIEVGVVMLLERNHGWTPGASGLGMAMTAITTILTSLATLGFEHLGFVQKVVPLGIMTACTFCGLSLLLYTDSNSSPAQLISAQILTCTSMYATSGMLDSLAVRAAIPHSAYCVENVQWARLWLMALGRFTGPPIALTIITSAGRTIYATFLLAVAALASSTVMGTVSVLRGRKLQEQEPGPAQSMLMQSDLKLLGAKPSTQQGQDPHTIFRAPGSSM